MGLVLISTLPHGNLLPCLALILLTWVTYAVCVYVHWYVHQTETLIDRKREANVTIDEESTPRFELHACEPVRACVFWKPESEQKRY